LLARLFGDRHLARVSRLRDRGGFVQRMSARCLRKFKKFLPRQLTSSEVNVVAPEIRKALIFQCFFFDCFKFTSYENEVNLKLANDWVRCLNYHATKPVYRPDSLLNLLNIQENFLKVFQFYFEPVGNVDLMANFY
jgi:hypothetical protein